MSKGGSTQVRTTARPSSSSPVTSALAGMASAEASRTSAAAERHPAPAGRAAVDRGRGPAGPDRQPAQGRGGEDGALHQDGLRVSYAEEDDRDQDGGQSQHGQQRGHPRATER